MRKNIIFFWSATGNSLHVAREISEHFWANGESCELVSVAAWRGESFRLDEGYEAVGFVFPVYFGGIPSPFEHFIEQLNLSAVHDAHIFSVVTCGGSGGNSTNADLEQLLNCKKKGLSSAHTITYYSSYYILHTELVYTTRPRSKVQTQAGDRKLAEVVGAILARRPTKIPRMNPLYHFGYDRKRHSLSHCDERFVTNRHCTSCGQCAELCPMNNIGLVSDKPYWQHNCALCLACLHWCPNRAIEYGTVSRFRERYHHPAVTAKEIHREKSQGPFSQTIDFRNKGR
ncbi:MAG: EFR1 family ferrodoxin [Coriobacteriales bacterium]|jgi:ferredoxin/flavodoxin|nr:EFR1 family ferrodoxin [Coriobacteriales bacterium]